MNIVDRYPEDWLAIIVDCGKESLFYSMHHELYEKMLKLKMLHDYIGRPEMDEWNYWANAVRCVVVFKNNFEQ